jgi:hypothetical protein
MIPIKLLISVLVLSITQFVSSAPISAVNKQDAPPLSGFLVQGYIERFVQLVKRDGEDGGGKNSNQKQKQQQQQQQQQNNQQNQAPSSTMKDNVASATKAGAKVAQASASAGVQKDGSFVIL